MKKSSILKSVFTFVAIVSVVTGSMDSIHAEAQGTTTYGGCTVHYGSLLTGRSTAHGYTSETPLKHKVSVSIIAYGTTPTGSAFTVSNTGSSNSGEALCDISTSKGNLSSVYGTHYIGNYMIKS